MSDCGHDEHRGQGETRRGRGEYTGTARRVPSSGVWEPCPAPPAVPTPPDARHCGPDCSLNEDGSWTHDDWHHRPVPRDTEARSEAMTAERLAEIRQHAEERLHDRSQQRLDLLAVLREVDRLRAPVAPLVEVEALRAVNIGDDMVERAARAALEAFGWDVATPMPWDEAPEDFRITFRKVARAVAAALGAPSGEGTTGV